MRHVSRRSIGAGVTAFMVLAAIVGIIGEIRDWWDWVDDKETVPVANLSATMPSTTSTSVRAQPPRPCTTASTDTAPKEMLKTALSVPSSTKRGEALMIVATTAVAQCDYETAIEAGTSTPGATKSGETLSFVARCAAQDGLFHTAHEAADKIPSSSVQGHVKVDLLKMRQHQETLGIHPRPGQPGWVHCR